MLVSLGAFAEEGGKPAKGEKPSPEAMKKMWAEFAEPGPEHKEMLEMVGRWKAETKDYFDDPDKPTLSEGTATFKPILDGRFIQQDYQCKQDGKTFRGLGVFGYDKAKKKWVSVWLDSMSTGFMVMEGEFDKATETLVETGEMASPIGPMKMKNVIKELDDDRMQMTMYLLLPGDKEQKVMEILYTRQK
jgi:hypothetical protein